MQGEEIVVSALNAMNREDFNGNPDTLRDQGFFETKPLATNVDNFMNDQVMENQRLNATFNLQQLPPPPALPSNNHSTASSGNQTSSDLITVTQSSQPISEQYFSQIPTSEIETSTANYPQVPSNSRTQILQQPAPQPSGPNFGLNSTAPTSPSQALITHYPHSLNENMVQSHVVHHRPNAEIEHFHPHISMQHSAVDGDPNIVHPQNMEMAQADALLQLQPVYDQARNVYVYPNNLMGCPGSTSIEGHPMGSEIPHSHQSSSKMEIDPSNEHFMSNALQRSLNGGIPRAKKREAKMEEMDHDIYDSNQPVPDKTIEDVLKGTPGNEVKKRKIDELLK